MAGRFGQAALKDAGDTIALFRILELRIGGIDIIRKRAFLDDPFSRVFIGRHHHFGCDAEFAGQCRQKLF
ncbi:hypothetical protein D3C73_484800 [compost metagenome]